MSSEDFVPVEGEAVSVTATLVIGIHTAGRPYRFKLDPRSANFLAHALLDYLKPFQSNTDGGTPSVDPANPSS